jgi:hypothetical protein
MNPGQSMKYAITMESNVITTAEAMMRRGTDDLGGMIDHARAKGQRELRDQTGL